MSVPLFAGNWDMDASNGGGGPDPVTVADTGWTWDVEFDPSDQSLYARATLHFFSSDGGGWGGGGVVEYRTRDPDGTDLIHSVGQSSQDGIADFIWDFNVDSVTFGLLIWNSAWGTARVDMELWM